MQPVHIQGYRGIIKSRFSTGHEQTFEDDKNTDGSPVAYTKAAEVTDQMGWIIYGAQRNSRGTPFYTYSNFSPS